jgi:alkanesulfonate monooxygenase SsuD/methylene tetrahydromethanopterin reductase-like flavin-dependent oxidoreductase (luciferase family)
VRISFFTDVANLPLRPPAVMAKAAASLDVLSGGRFELGLGAGAIQDQITRMGGPSRSPAESVDALEEAIEVIRLMWSSERSVSFEGKYYTLEDARPGPLPVHPMGIWLGAFKPRMLRLVGRKADGWVPSLGVLSADELRAGNDRIDAAAAHAGRDPRRIRRVLNLQGVIGESRTPPDERLPRRLPDGRTARRAARVVGRDAQRLRRGRLRHAHLLARRPLASPGRAPCGRGRAVARLSHPREPEGNVTMVTCRPLEQIRVDQVPFVV